MINDDTIMMNRGHLRIAGAADTQIATSPVPVKLVPQNGACTQVACIYKRTSKMKRQAIQAINAMLGRRCCHHMFTADNMQSLQEEAASAMQKVRQPVLGLQCAHQYVN